MAESTRIICATEPGNSARPNEDFAAVAPGLAVLLDGAGSPAGLDTGCVHSVTWYARTLGGLLLAAALDTGWTLVQALEAGIEQVNALHAGTCDLGNPHSPSATVLAARVVGGRLEYLVLSDSVLILEQRGEAPLAVSDDRIGEVSRRIADRNGIPPTGSAEAATALLEHVRKLGAYRNQPGGFWIASTAPAAAREAITGGVDLADLDSVTLLSDGASRLADKFRLLSWLDVLAVLRDEGPSELIAKTREAEAGDPHGERWRRSKTFDDATAVYWALRSP